jgi:hypothetical protein
MSTGRKARGAIAALGAGAALVAGAITMGGCGASEALDPVARAAQVTGEQPGARFTMTMRMSAPGLSSGFTITAKGYVDERSHSGELTMDFSQMPFASALGGNGTFKMIFAYPVIYMNVPFMAGKLPEGKTWMKADLSKAAQAMGAGGSQLSSFDQTDPTQFLSYLRASSGGVTKLGQESVEGVQATHYRATIQLSHILERYPSAQQAAMRSALAKLGNGDSIPVDAWVDAQGRVRREQVQIGSTAAGSTAPGGAGATGAVGGTITIDFQSFGPVPPIVPPPANEVVDAGAMASSAMSSGG